MVTICPVTKEAEAEAEKDDRPGNFVGFADPTNARTTFMRSIRIARPREEADVGDGV